MNRDQSRAFLKGEMEFTPSRMLRYIRSRARLSTDEDIEDILQNALVLVTQHFDPEHPEANLSLYCLGACNKAIAQNLERYHKVQLRKRSESRSIKPAQPASGATRIVEEEGTLVKVSTLAPGTTFDSETPSGQLRTVSLDSLFDDEDGRSADDVFGVEYRLAGNAVDQDPAARALVRDLIRRILHQLPTPIHRTCFLLKYVQGYKREDLIECLKMDAKSIDTVDKKIVRTLKAFKEKLDQEESHLGADK